MHKILAALLALVPSIAMAQVPTTLAPNTALGRLGVSPGPAQAIPFATFTPGLLSSLCPAAVTGTVPVYDGTAGTWRCASIPITSGAAAPYNDAVASTQWIEMDAFLPGIITRVDDSLNIAFNAAYLDQKIRAMYAQGTRRFIILGISHNTRTYTRWTIPYPTNFGGVTFHWWYDDVQAGLKLVEDFDIVASIINTCAELFGCKVILGPGQLDDVNFLNDYNANPSNPTVQQRLAFLIASYATQSADLYKRFGNSPAFGGFYNSFESDSLLTSGALYTPINQSWASLYPHVERHIAIAVEPALFGVDAANADAINDFRTTHLWTQTGSGYGYNSFSKKYAYVGGISVYGAAALVSTVRDVINFAYTRPGASNTPKLGVVIEYWRQGETQLATFTPSALGGTSILTTAGSPVFTTAHIGRLLFARSSLSGNTDGVGVITGLGACPGGGGVSPNTIACVTTTGSVGITTLENFSTTGTVPAGAWAIVPADFAAIPAPGPQVHVETQLTRAFVDELSLNAEAYWNPGNLTIKMRQDQGGITDYNTRAVDGWNDHARVISHVSAVNPFFAWANTQIKQPAANSFYIYDISAGAGFQGKFVFATMGSGITYNAGAIGLSTTVPATKIRAVGAAPTLSACGTGPAISGSDLAGEVTMGTTAAGCVITFNAAYAATPYCTVTWQATPLASQSYVVTLNSITLTQTATSSNKVSYNCIARSGG